MKTILILILLCMAVPVQALDLTKFELEGAMYVPKHERTFVCQQERFCGKVPRYEFSFEFELEYNRVYYGADVDLFGMQTWRDQRGYNPLHSLEDADYGVDNWGLALTHKFGYRFEDKKYFKSEWFNECQISQLEDYSCKTGVRAKFR